MTIDERLERLKGSVSTDALKLLRAAHETALFTGDDQMIIGGDKGATIIAVKTVTWHVPLKDVLMVVKPTTTYAEMQHVVDECVARPVDVLRALMRELETLLTAPLTEAELEQYTS